MLDFDLEMRDVWDAKEHHPASCLGVTMSNERLRAAMIEGGLTAGLVAERLQVDPKTVKRWLGGRIPHPQHRFALARALDKAEEYLWPEVRRSESNSGAAEIVAAYPFRADVDAAHWWTMFTKARHQIDLLGFTLYFLPQQHPQLIDVLLEKCQKGCQIRIVIADPDSQYVHLRDEEERDPITLVARIESSRRAFEPLLACDGADMRYQDAPLYNSIFRFDDEMFVTTHLYATLGNRAPLFHLRRLGPGGLFSRYASHFEGIWSDTNPMGQDRTKQLSRSGGDASQRGGYGTTGLLRRPRRPRSQLARTRRLCNRRRRPRPHPPPPPPRQRQVGATRRQDGTRRIHR